MNDFIENKDEMNTQQSEFIHLLSNFQGILHKVNLIYFRNKTDREDNFQEMVYQLWKSYPTFKRHTSIGSWIYSVAINTSITRLRKGSRIKYQTNLPEVTDHFVFYEHYEQNESLNLLLGAIQKLDDVDKTIMLLYLEEQSYDEIAEIVGITKSNVGVRISRAKENLKRQFNSNKK